MSVDPVRDRLDVIETGYCYGYGLDTDRALLREVLDDEILLDYSSYTGRPGGPITADDWCTGISRVFENLAGTQHSMTNPFVDVSGDTAAGRMYVRAHHVYDAADPDSWYTLGGIYDQTFRRSGTGPRGWVFTGVTLTVLWDAGDRQILAAAAQGPPQPSNRPDPS